MNELLDHLYAAALGEADWSEVLCSVADHCGAENAALVRVDQLLGTSSVLAPRADPGVTAAYNTYWWAFDPTVEATQEAPVGRVTSLQDTGREHFLRSTFHNEFWAYSGLGAERLAVNLRLDTHGFASCVLQGRAGTDTLGDDAHQAFHHLVPHLIRAVEIQIRLQKMAYAASIASISTVPGQLGIVVVDVAGRVLWADDGGEALLSRGGALAVKGGKLFLDTPQEQAQLIRAVNAAVNELSDLSAPRSIRLNTGNRPRAVVIEVIPWRKGRSMIDTERPAAFLRLHDGTEPAETVQQGPPANAVTARPRGRSRAALGLAVKTDIARHLDNSDLSLDWLAQRHGVPPRRIRDLFYAENTNFTDYVMEARLERAREMLADPEHAQVNIATIALDCGFGDISWFHHVFRRRFGMTPAAMRSKSLSDTEN